MCSVKKVFLEGLQLYLKRGSGTGIFCEISKNIFFHRAPLVAAFEIHRVKSSSKELSRTFASNILRN